MDIKMYMDCFLACFPILINKPMQNVKHRRKSNGYMKRSLDVFLRSSTRIF